MKKAIYIILIIAFIVAFLFIISKLTSCTSKKTAEAATSSTTELVKASTVDSVLSIPIKKRIAKLDSSICRRAKFLKNEKSDAAAKTAKYSTQKSKYQKDTIHSVVIDSLIISADNAISSQNQYADSLEKQVSDNSKKNRLLQKKDSLNAATNAAAINAVSALQKQAKQSWFSRNKFAIGVGSGVIVTITAIYLLSKLF